jgi:multicomponent Na+:H+ antiporter subunit A
VIFVLSLAAMLSLAAAAPPVYRRRGRTTGYVLAAGFTGVGGLLATQVPTVLGGGATVLAERERVLASPLAWPVGGAHRLRGVHEVHSFLCTSGCPAPWSR